MKNINIVLVFIFGVILVSCDTATDGPSVKRITISSPVSYGNGVYYFSCVQEDFAASLSAFLADTSIIFKGMTGNGRDIYGQDMGYFVVVEKAKKIETPLPSPNNNKMAKPNLRSARSKALD